MTDAPDEVRQAIAKLDVDIYAKEAAERVKHQVTLAERGFQSLMFMNGGALVALFTLLGKAHLAFHSDLLWTAFGFFSGGLVLTVLAVFGGFLSQGFYVHATMLQLWDAQRAMYGLEGTRDPSLPYRRGRLAEFAGMAGAVLALIAFIVGCGLALAGVLPA